MRLNKIGYYWEIIVIKDFIRSPFNDTCALKSGIKNTKITKGLSEIYVFSHNIKQITNQYK